MKPYFVELEHPEIPTLTKKLQDVILPEFGSKKDFWNFCESAALLEKLPEFKEFISKNFGTIEKLYVLVVPPPDASVKARYGPALDDNSIHIDDGPETYRLNWPLKNGNSIETRFFKTNGNKQILKLPTGENYIKIDIKDCVHVDTLILEKPTLFNVKEAHGLYRRVDSFPRVLLSIRFKNDISIDNF